MTVAFSLPELCVLQPSYSPDRTAVIPNTRTRQKLHNEPLASTHDPNSLRPRWPETRNPFGLEQQRRPHLVHLNRKQAAINENLRVTRLDDLEDDKVKTVERC